MKRWLTALGALAMMNGGCAPIVLDPFGTGSEGAPAVVVSALAIRAGDAPPSLGYALDPDALVILLTNGLTRGCAAPVGAPWGPTHEEPPPSCDGSTEFWRFTVVIPPDLDRPGLIDLASLRIFTHIQTWRDVCVGASGDGWGPGLFPGTLEIVSSDATSVSVTLRNGTLQGGVAIMSPTEDLPAFEGEYTAQRCGAAPPPPPPSPALAILGSKLPTPPSGSPPVDPTALYFFLGTGAQSCADPWADLACTGTSRTMFTLPAALQTPGTLDLTEPSLAAAFTASLNPPGCNPLYDVSTGTFPQGTLEILSLDASGASLHLYGADSVPLGYFDADGLYAATMCP